MWPVTGLVGVQLVSALVADTTRPTFWHIGGIGKVVFYYLALVSVLIFCYGVYDRVTRYTRGAADPADRLDGVGARVRDAARTVLSNRNQFNRDTYAGIMHSLILWGFLTLFVATAILGVELDAARRLGFSFWHGDFYLAYSFIADVFGLAFIVGIVMALYRRYVTRTERLRGKHTSLEDDAFVWTLFFLGVTGFLLEGLRILGTHTPSFSIVSVVGYAVRDGYAAAGMTPEMAAAAYPYVWWLHALCALAFVAAIPTAKPLHMLTSYANLVARDEDAGRRLPRVPADADPEDIGASDIDDFTWKQLLDHDACTKCGRCSSVCPAKASGRPLDPRDVILDLKRYREDRDADATEDVDIVADGGTSVIDASTMESCMSCMACMDACPVDIEHVTQFTEMNRRLVESGQMEANVQETMMDLFQQGNAFGNPARKRPDWVEELDFEVPDAREEPVEFLWYVGDYPSYDDRNRKVARSLARILHEADVSYGILYEDESHDGNDVRRVGEEGLYEMLAEDNIEAFEACDYEKIITTDPHSFNTFRNEYDQFGFEDGDSVYHYTQVVENFVDQGRLELGSLDSTVTYHDPCHLGRYNGEYEAPREVIRATGARLDEMPRNRDDSFCCGGGGGGVWMDNDDDPKPSEERLREATEDTMAGNDVDAFVVACPQCMTMYEDGRKTGGYEDAVEILDISELVVQALNAR